MSECKVYLGNLSYDTGERWDKLKFLLIKFQIRPTNQSRIRYTYSYWNLLACLCHCPVISHCTVTQLICQSFMSIIYFVKFSSYIPIYPHLPLFCGNQLNYETPILLQDTQILDNLCQTVSVRLLLTFNFNYALQSSILFHNLQDTFCQSSSSTQSKKISSKTPSFCSCGSHSHSSYVVPWVPFGPPITTCGP